MPLLRFLFSPRCARRAAELRGRAAAGAGENTRRPDTLYFGGGTPALLVPAQAAALIKAANPLPGAEITLEANPDVVTPETLRGFRAAGVTRISFGVQSADDAQLRRLGRTHTAAGAAQALAWAREAGFPEICGDIMLALPEYTNAEFDLTLALLRDGGCTHISAYLLKVEPGTAFYRNPPAGLPDGDAAADFYLYAVQQLEAAGYRQYEISNFARPGHEGRHNLCTGTAAIIGASALPPTAVWAMCGGSGPTTCRDLSRVPRPSSARATARRRIIC